MRALLPLALLAMSAGCAAPATPNCFAPGTVLPTAAEAPGGTARTLAEALLQGDVEAAATLLNRDPALARTRVGKDADMLVVALATCRHDAVDLLLDHGADADGLSPGVPLTIALRANEPWYAERLLKAGASANPRGSPLGPITTAIALGSPGGVRLLLDHGADVNARERTGNTALLTALDMDQFTTAELLLARGADPWAIDSSGGNLGSSVTRPVVATDRAQVEAQRRLAARLPSIGWPTPVPDPRTVRTLALEGAWPLAGARGARPVPAEVLDIMRANAAPQ